MDLTTLDGLLATGCARPTAKGLTVSVSPDWIVAGESRLSYTTMVRLAECVRERHWATDVSGAARAHLDSILRSYNADFIEPVDSGSIVDITYEVTSTMRRSYELTIQFRDHRSGVLHAVVRMICVVFERTQNIALGARSARCQEAVALLGGARRDPAIAG